MDEKLARMAALAGTSKDVVDKLEEILSGPNDRAYVVCTYADCRLHSKGRCTIYTVLDVPRMKTSGPCASYEKLSTTAGS